MQPLNSVSELREFLAVKASIVFVPTMGNLHEGHIDLVRQARNHGECVVVSIFVNPLQFGPAEDFDKYPRTLAEDCKKLQGLADAVFAPSVNEMYPQQQTMCGAPRLSHRQIQAWAAIRSKLVPLEEDM